MRRAVSVLAILAAAVQAQEWIALPAGQWQEVTGLPFPARSWMVEGDVLKALPDNTDGMQDLRTPATYRNFEFEFQWKLDNGANSGVKYLIQKTDRWRRKDTTGFQARARGLEYQLIDDEINPDAKNGPSRGTGALYSILPPARKAPPVAGSWHASRIVVADGKVQHWLDGARVLEFELSHPDVNAALKKMRGAGDIALESPISLQNHGGGVQFRNLRVRRLP